MNTRTRNLLSVTLALFLAVVPSISSAGVTNINGLSANTQFLATTTTMHMNIVSATATHTFQWDGTPWAIAQGGTGATSFTDGSIPFIYNGVFSQDNSQLFWDNTNSILSIGGATSPSAKVTIKGSGSLALLNVAVATGASAFHINSSGNVGIGNTTPQHALDVSGAMYSRLVTASAPTINWNSGNVQTLTLTSNPTLTFTGGQAGGEYKLILKQDGTGARTVTWPTDVQWSNGTAPTLTSSANAKDMISFVKDGDNKYLGSYSLNYVTLPVVEYLIVAGGGAGDENRGGGGGGGGVLFGSVPIVMQAYPITVGTGGTFVYPTKTSGSNSSFNGNTAIGGGYGAGQIGAAASGGSGGGGSIAAFGTTPGNGIAGQGNAGGVGVDQSAFDNGSGGGGGGTATFGSQGTLTVGGHGGEGMANSISGSSVVYGSGGGGSVGNIGTGGNGGTNAGDGADAGASGTSAVANRGGGGGGGSNNYGGGDGGSGVVIISYPTGSITATGGTITTVGGNTVHTFTSSGTFTVMAVN